MRAQSANAGSALTSGRDQHSGVFVTGYFQSPTLTDTTSATDQRGSGFFTSPAATNQSFSTVPGAATGFTTSTSFGPADAFGNSITGNDLFSPYADVFRSNLLSDSGVHTLAGVGMLDTRGANHFEASLAPHWVLYRKSRYPITVTLPIQVMAADDPYYFGHHYGWMTGGVNFRVPLSFLPKQLGNWSAGTSADLCYYGTTTNEFANSLGLQMPKLAAALTLGF